MPKILAALLWKSRRIALSRAVFGTVLSAIIFLPVANVIAHRRGVPPINDITTDVNNPPEFVHAQEQLANPHVEADPALALTAMFRAQARIEAAAQIRK